MRDGPYITHYAASARAGNRRRHFAMPASALAMDRSDTDDCAYNALDFPAHEFTNIRFTISLAYSLPTRNTMNGRNIAAPTLTSVRPGHPWRFVMWS
jgi:hypothetical protein